MDGSRKVEAMNYEQQSRRLDRVELDVRPLARTAKAFNMPVVLSTVGVKYGINGPQRFACDSSLKRGQAAAHTNGMF